MRVNVVQGDFVDAEVLRLIGGAVVVELDTSEEAVLPLSKLLGNSSSDKTDRYCSLRPQQMLRVQIEEIYAGRNFQRKINAREVKPLSSK